MNRRLKERIRNSGVVGSIGQSAIGKPAKVVFGRGSATRLFALHDGIVQSSDLPDLDGELLAGLQKNPARPSVAGRRAGGDNVAGPQREFLGKVGDLLGDG